MTADPLLLLAGPAAVAWARGHGIRLHDVDWLSAGGVQSRAGCQEPVARCWQPISVH